MKKLTPKQELFVIEYAKDFNATQAAIRAGYSRHTANEQGAQLLAKLSDVIGQRKQEVLAKRGSAIANLEQTLKLCTILAFGDRRKLYDSHGNPKELPDLTRNEALIVEGFEVTEEYAGRGEQREKVGYTKKFHTAPRAPFVHMLLKFHGAFAGKGESAPPPPSRFDPSKLTKEEWAEYKRLHSKAASETIVVNQ